MKKFLKWLGLVVGGLAGLAVIVIAYVFIASERELGREYTALDTPAIPIPSDPAEIAEGRRVAHLAGCTHCHSENLTGAVPLDIPSVVRFVAPNLTTTLPNYSDAQLAALLRRGVKADNTGALFMPSEMFRHMNDRDLARVIAFVRSMPVAQGVTGTTEIRPMGRLILAKGDFKSSARAIEELPPADTAVDMSDPVSRGRYLAMNFCSECHGQDLNGRPVAHAPSLAVAKGYSPEQFARLMHEGIGLGERQFELMTPTARARFSHFSAEEVAALHAFLQSRPALHDEAVPERRI
jgi:cytochrome c553